MRLYSFILPIVIIAAVIAGVGGYFYLNGLDTYTNVKASPLSHSKNNDELKRQPEEKVEKSDLETNNIINILLLGIDRRSRQESSYRTDTMILLSIDKLNNRVLMTSVPRDLWYGGGRLNAYYISSGWEGIQTAFKDITGQMPDRYILTDFKDFSWIVDAFGGVPVNVETTFTDNLYPNDETNEYMTVSFTKGPEVLTGDRALIFARSRKGDNDNGDWGRMKRQHLIVKSMVEAVVQPKSFVCDLTDNPFRSDTNSCAEYITADTLEKVLKKVTTSKMETNLKVTDLAYLWDFYKDKDKYTTDSLLMDYNYLYTPPMEEYGGAWVLAPIGESFDGFHKAVQNGIAGIVPEIAPEVVKQPEVSEDALTQNPTTQP